MPVEIFNDFVFVVSVICAHGVYFVLVCASWRVRETFRSWFSVQLTKKRNYWHFLTNFAF